jgi:hypothetical protein
MPLQCNSEQCIDENNLFTNAQPNEIQETKIHV